MEYKKGDTFVVKTADYLFEYEVIDIDKETKTLQVKLISTWFMEEIKNA
jgi:hypothetical protein